MIYYLPLTTKCIISPFMISRIPSSPPAGGQYYNPVSVVCPSNRYLLKAFQVDGKQCWVLQPEVQQIRYTKCRYVVRYISWSTSFFNYLYACHSLRIFWCVIHYTSLVCLSLFICGCLSFVTYLWVRHSLRFFKYVFRYLSLDSKFVTYRWIGHSLLSFRYVIRYSCLSTYFLTYLTNNFTWKQKLAEMAFEKLIKLR